MRVVQHLWFEKDMAAALAFYTSLVPGSGIQRTWTLPVASPSGPAGSVTVADFTIGDQRYQGLEAGPLDPFNHSFSIIVECADQAEIDRLWDALLDGGTAEACGWLRDRWGLCWQIVPSRFWQLMDDPDPAVAVRVSEALLTMVRIDIAALEAAARG